LTGPPKPVSVPGRTGLFLFAPQQGHHHYGCVRLSFCEYLPPLGVEFSEDRHLIGAQCQPDCPLYLPAAQRSLLSFTRTAVWLTYLAVGIITLMDEFTSIFYVPAEAYRFIALSAMVFIAVTSLLIRFISTRLTEIAEILEHHQLIGGGVYSFSYLVLGPLVSFIAVSSIMVDYI
jgi:uncharacterized membrane protein YidH (DUF202 family)